MKNALFALVTLILLAGCDAANEALAKVVKEQAPMTLVFLPGYKMLVGGQPAPVFGYDECPKGDGFMRVLFGPAPDEGEDVCVVIPPDAKSVKVLVGLPAGPTQETWAVERDGNRTMLRRADGSYLTEAK